MERWIIQYSNIPVTKLYPEEQKTLCDEEIYYIFSFYNFCYESGNRSESGHNCSQGSLV